MHADGARDLPLDLTPNWFGTVSSSVSASALASSCFSCSIRASVSAA